MKTRLEGRVQNPIFATTHAQHKTTPSPANRHLSRQRSRSSTIVVTSFYKLWKKHKKGFSHTPLQRTALRSGVREQQSSSSEETNSLQENMESDGPDPPSQSWALVALCALSVVICYADRSTISTAILPMAETYGWDKSFTGVVLSTFFFGYAATQLAGGQLADKAGAKNVLTGGVIIWSLCTAITPTAAALGTAPLLTARLGLGLGEGVAFPAIHSLISRHVPSEQQSTAVGVVTAASYLGAALAFQATPLIIREVGWEAAFTGISGLALLWLPFWLVFPLPPSNASAAAGGAGAAGEGGAGRWAELVPLLARREVWAICAAQYCGSWGLYVLLSWLPTFFSEVYGLKVEEVGGYTFLPYVVQGGMGVLAGMAADRLLQREQWRKREVRLLLQCTGMLGPAACLLLAVSPQVASQSPGVASAVITVGLGLSALTLGGVSANHLDIAPRHAGAIFGAGNTAACIAGLVSVPVTGWLLDSTDSWALVLGVTAAHYVGGAGVYCMWMGGDVLPEDSAPSV